MALPSKKTFKELDYDFERLKQYIESVFDDYNSAIFFIINIEKEINTIVDEYNKKLEECMKDYTPPKDKRYKLIKNVEKINNAALAAMLNYFEKNSLFEILREYSLNPNKETFYHTVDDITILKLLKDYKIELIERQLLNKTEKNESAAMYWLKDKYPRIYNKVDELEKAGLIKKTETGFDWQLKKTVLAKLLNSNYGASFNKQVVEYFTFEGKKSSLGTMHSLYKKGGGLPAKWEKVQAIFPNIIPN